MEEPLTDKHLQNLSEDLKRDEWRRLGRLLGLEDPELDSVECDYEDNGFKEVCYQMLKTWQCKLGSGATRHDLDQAVQEIKTKSNTSLDSLDSPYKEIALLLQTLMKEEYSSLQLPRVSWYLQKNMDLKELYVDLSLNLLDNQGNVVNENISIQDIFNDINSGGDHRRVLIEGGAGYGKTTLVCKLVSDWADGQNYISGKFLLVFVVLLRHFRGNLKENLLNQFDIDEYDKADALETIYSIAQQTLLILDGFDELDDVSKNSLMNTLKKKGFREMTVITTSRTAEMFTEKMEKKDSLSSIGAKTKTSVVLSFWNKRISIEGISEERRKEFLGKYLEIDPSVVTQKFSHIVDKSLNLYQCPLFLFLLATIVEEENTENVTTTAELYMNLFTFLIKKTYENDFEITEKITNVFDPVNSDSARDRLLLLEFGELAYKKIQEHKCSFTEKEILSHCSDGKKILRYGFLSKNTQYCKRQYEFSYEPIHKTFLEFLACFYLSVNEHLLKEFICDIISGTRDTFCLSFIIKLMADRAHAFLNIFSQYSGILPIEFIFDIYSEMEETEENERAFVPFISTIWATTAEYISSKHVIKPQYYLSRVRNQPQKKSSLLQLSSENSLIDKYEWNILAQEDFPHGFYVPILKLKCLGYQNQYKEIKEKRLHCDELVCYSMVCRSKRDWKEIVMIINCIQFKEISFDRFNFVGDSWKFFLKELSVGKWKHIIIKHLKITEFSEETLYVLKYCLINNRVKQIFSAIGFESDLLSLAFNSKYLTSCHVEDNCRFYLNPTSTSKIELSELFRNKKRWEYLYIPPNIEWTNYSQVTKFLSIASIKFSHELPQIFKDHCCKILSLCQGLKSLSLSLTLFSFCTATLPVDWSGFESVIEIELIIGSKIEKEDLKFLLKFRSLQILTITFAPYYYQKKYSIVDYHETILSLPFEDLGNLIDVLQELSFDTLNFKIVDKKILPFVNYFLRRVNANRNDGRDSTCEFEPLTKNEYLGLMPFQNLRIHQLSGYEYDIMDTVVEDTLLMALEFLYEKQMKNFYFRPKWVDLDMFYTCINFYANRFIFKQRILNKSDGFFTRHESFHPEPEPIELWITRLDDEEIEQTFNNKEPVFRYVNSFYVQMLQTPTRSKSFLYNPKYLDNPICSDNY